MLVLTIVLGVVLIVMMVSAFPCAITDWSEGEWRDIDKIIIGIILSLIIALCVCIPLTVKEQNEYTRTKALCDSVGGTYGGGVCYKDGTKITTPAN